MSVLGRWFGEQKITYSSLYLFPTQKLYLLANHTLFNFTLEKFTLQSPGLPKISYNFYVRILSVQYKKYKYKLKLGIFIIFLLVKM